MKALTYVESVKNNMTLTIFSAYQARSSPSESVNRLQSSGYGRCAGANGDSACAWLLGFRALQ